MTPVTVEARGLSKSFGTLRAVDEVSFTARPGRVTGVLGPNGAGKTTTLRMLLWLVRPDRGSALIAHRPYRDLPFPSRTVGAVIDLASAHPRMTARGHLRTYARLGGLPRERVGAVLAEVDAEGFAGRRIGTFSTGMRQRLALATALLGDPDVLVLDEPSSGLDPAGIAWLRSLVRERAARGRTVLLSSHVLAEVQQSVDDVVLLDAGRTAWSGTLDDLVATAGSLERAVLAATGAGAAS